MIKKINFLKVIILIKIIILYFSKDKSFYQFLLNNRKFSFSQVYQDLFVFFHSKLIAKGFFVEIGVGNGRDISNTYYLEKKKWKGILCEADRRMIKEIKANRNSKLVSIPISNICNKNFKFFENIKDPYLSGSKYNSECKIRYTKSICVNHLLKKNKAPNIINYMSIDIKGNEYEIIKRINFKKWKILIITIELNFNLKKRNKVYIFFN